MKRQPDRIPVEFLRRLVVPACLMLVTQVTTGQAQQSASTGSGVADQNGIWHATRPQLVYRGKSADRHAALPSLIRLPQSSLLALVEHEPGKWPRPCILLNPPMAASVGPNPLRRKCPLAMQGEFSPDIS